MTALFFFVRVAILIWRFSIVYRQSMNIAKGIGLGVVAGAAVAAVSSKMMGSRKSAKTRAKEMRKSTAKAVHTVGQLIDGVESILK